MLDDMTSAERIVEQDHMVDGWVLRRHIIVKSYIQYEDGSRVFATLYVAESLADALRWIRRLRSHTHLTEGQRLSRLFVMRQGFPPYVFLNKGG